MDRDDLTMTLAANIKAEMDAQKTDAAKLARAANINATGVYDILSGKSASPRLATIQKIADALGTSVQYLLRDRSRDELSNQAASIIEALPRDDQNKILIMVKALTENSSTSN